MSPMVEFPPVIPPACQLMVVLVVPVTLAVNCLDWLLCTVALLGEMETEIAGPGVGLGVGVGVDPLTVSDSDFL